ncbi:hypothetical protein D9M70_580540 [compost metagenome]
MEAGECAQQEQQQAAAEQGEDLATQGASQRHGIAPLGEGKGIGLVYQPDIAVS